MKCRMMRFSLCLIALTFFSLTLHARGKQGLVNCGSWIYDAMTEIAMEEGRVDFSDQAPLSIAEIELYLSEADYDSLSEAGKKNYDRIVDYIAYEPPAFKADIFSISVEPEMNVEGFYKTNDDIDWVYDRYCRQPLLTTPLNVQGGDYFTLSMDVTLREYDGAAILDNNYSNFIYADSKLTPDINFPHTAYGSVGYKFNDNAGVNLQVGMGPQSVGRSLSGSIIWSEYFTGASYANLDVFSKNFRYNMNVTEFNVDKYAYTHRLEVRLFKKLQFSIMESMLVNSSLELRFMNPFTMFHGMAPWRDYGDEDGDLDHDDPESHTCDYLAIKAVYVPVKNLRLYGLFAMNQYQTFYERKNWENDTTPNSMAFQAGAESYIPFKGGNFHFWLEGTYTQPYMYVKEDPNWSLVRTYSENLGDKAIFYEWVGSPFGPDTVAGELNMGYEVPGKWDVTASYLFKAAGEYSGTKLFTDDLDWGGQDKVPNRENWAYPDSDKEGGQDRAKKQQGFSTPHGTPEYLNRVALRASFSPSPLFTISAQPAFVFIFNKDNIDGEFASGGEFAVSAKINLSRLF